MVTQVFLVDWGTEPWHTRLWPAGWKHFSICITVFPEDYIFLVSIFSFCHEEYSQRGSTDFCFEVINVKSLIEESLEIPEEKEPQTFKALPNVCFDNMHSQTWSKQNTYLTKWLCCPRCYTKRAACCIKKGNNLISCWCKSIKSLIDSHVSKWTGSFEQ